MIVTNYSSAVDLGVMLGRVAICFKAGQEDYGKQCTRGVRHMKWYLPQLLWPGTQESYRGQNFKKAEATTLQR